MVQDEKLARQFQERYLQGERGALAGLYSELRFFTECSAWKYYRDRHISIDRGRIDEIAHDAASRIIERYLKYDGYYVQRFHKVAKLAVLGLVTGTRIDSTISLQDTNNTSKSEINTNWDRNDMGGNSYGFEQRSVIDIALAQSYKKALLSIAGYAPMWWISSRAERLHQIYRMTRGKKGSKGNNCRPRDMGGDKETVPGTKQECELSGRMASKQVE